jgi:hypothetical protein
MKSEGSLGPKNLSPDIMKALEAFSGIQGVEVSL